MEVLIALVLLGSIAFLGYLALDAVRHAGKPKD